MGAKRPQIVFVGRVIAMPGDDIERRVIEIAGIELAAPFDGQAAGRVLILEGRHRRLEIARVGKAVCADRAAVRECELCAVIFAEVAARGTVLRSTLNFTPRGMTQISPGPIPMRPNSVKNVQPSKLRHDE